MNLITKVFKFLWLLVLSKVHGIKCEFIKVPWVAINLIHEHRMPVALAVELIRIGQMTNWNSSVFKDQTKTV